MASELLPSQAPRGETLPSQHSKAIRCVGRNLPDLGADPSLPLTCFVSLTLSLNLAAPVSSFVPTLHPRGQLFLRPRPVLQWGHPCAGGRGSSPSPSAPDPPALSRLVSLPLGVWLPVYVVSYLLTRIGGAGRGRGSWGAPGGEGEGRNRASWRSGLRACSI